MMRNLVGLLAALSGLAGCSTAPTTVPKFNGATVVFVRDYGFLAGGCTFDAMIDGEVVGGLEAGKTISRSVAPGKHRVAIDNSTALCPNVKMSKVVDVAADPVVFRVGITSNMQVIFDQLE